jgi:transcriptional regulator with XRE-family HTH domain
MQEVFVNPSYLVGNRLREERERLDLSQAEAARLACVSREMWGRYERGAIPGGEVFVLLGTTPFDVLYILTGQRSQALGEAELLAPDERIMLDNYRHAPDPVRAGVKKTLGYFAPGGDDTHDGAGVKRAA